MPRKIARKTASQTAAAQKRELAALKRELKDKVKSAREAAAQAKKHLLEITAAKAGIAHLVERLLEEQKDLRSKVEGMDSRWEARVLHVVETVTANLRDGAKDDPLRSGTRASPLGRLAEEGLRGRRLPGSFESGGRR